MKTCSVNSEALIVSVIIRMLGSGLVAENVKIYIQCNFDEPSIDNQLQRLMPNVWLDFLHAKHKQSYSMILGK